MPAKSQLAARLEAILPRKVVSVAIPANTPSGMPFTILPGIAADLPIDPGTNMPSQPPSGFPAVYPYVPGFTGTFGGTGFDQPQVGGFWGTAGNILSGDTSPSSQGVNPSQTPGAPLGGTTNPSGAGTTVRSGSQGNESEEGDYPAPQGPEEQAGQEDLGNPEPEDQGGPTATAYNPEGDYSRVGLAPGVNIGGPGIASYDPEGTGSSSGTSGGVLGLRNPRGTAGMPNPEGGGPTGPAARGMTQSMAGMTSLGRLSAGSWLTGLTSSLRSGGV
jgi:hypothetical protein